MKTYCLDTSALLTLHYSENGFPIVKDILRKCQTQQAQAFISLISVMEIFYIVWQRSGKDEAIQTSLLLKMLPLQKIELDEELLLQAGEFKATRSLSLADAIIGATALRQKAVLVHKDPEFEELSEQIELMSLPYKS